MYAYSIVPEKLVKAQGAAFFQHPVGSGPFVVTSFNPDTEVDLARNPHFYGIRPKISKVKILIVPNDNTRVLELESKKVDVIENPPGNLVSEINKTPNLSVQLFPSTRVDFIQLDEHYAPLKKLAVRQALNYAINRNAIVQLAYQGHAIPGSSFMPYRMEYWNNSMGGKVEAIHRCSPSQVMPLEWLVSVGNERNSCPSCQSSNSARRG